MKVAILGCGPTGLLAAHACKLEGADFEIFSKKRKSQLFGSQYLHQPIPEVTRYDEHVGVKYVTLGTPEEYRRKTHGKWWDGHIAQEDFEPDHIAWNIRTAYDTLWQLYGHGVHHYEFITDEGKLRQYRGTTFDVARYDLQLTNFDLVINTMPRTIWQVPGDEFIFSEGWALGDAPEEGKFIPHEITDNTIICDGTPDTAWTRLSRVFGYGSVEWPHHTPRPPLPGVAMVTKPLHYLPSTQVANPTAEWLHVGRYGKFEKGVVVTDAFEDVLRKLQEMKVA